MDLVAVITQLKVYVPLFQGRVAGISEWDETMMNEVRPEAFPSAYVMPLDEDAEPNDDQNALYQQVKQHVGIVVEFDNTADRRGQSATQMFWPTKIAIDKAILNWRGTDPDHAQRGFEYVSGRQLGSDLARLFYMFTYSLLILLTDEDGWQVDTPYLTEIAAYDTAQAYETALADEHPNDTPPSFAYVPPPPPSE